MQECWVRANRRAFAFAAIAPTTIAVVLFAALWAGASYVDDAVAQVALFSLACLFLVGAIFSLGSAAYLMRTPRIAYSHGNVIVTLQPRSPEIIPLESVECFFLGREPVEIGSRPSRVSNIVVRLAERNQELQSRTLKTRFGGYRDGYLIVDGAWCEPITPELMKRINARLSEVRREHEAQLRIEEKATV
jgi:hypothetical protein